MHSAHLPIAALAASLCAAPVPGQSPAAVDTAALLAPVHQFLAVLNAHQDAAPAGVFTDDAVALDVIPPFVWTGPGAIRRWYNGLLGRKPATPKANDLATLDATLDIGTPASTQVSGDYARFVFPAVATYLDKGTRQRQVARWTITERRVGGRWRISAEVFDVTG